MVVAFYDYVDKNKFHLLAYYMSNWISWGYLLMAAVFEAAWTYCLKWMQFKELKQVKILRLVADPVQLKIIAPFAGYLFFGIANVFFFSLATRHIPLAAAFSVWMGCSLLLIKCSELYLLHQKMAPLELLFMLLIIAGVIGLKLLNARPD